MKHYRQRTLEREFSGQILKHLVEAQKLYTWKTVLF